MESPQFRPVTSSFTPVSVRRTFNRPTQPTVSTPVTAPPTASSRVGAQDAKRDWSPAVRAYVSRAFAVENVLPGVEREEMETRLKKVISDAAASEKLLTVDWINLPLPQHMILQERTARAQLFSNPLYNGGIIPLSLPETNHKALESPSKKRKSSELDTFQPAQEKIPPWRQNANKNVFEDRVSFADNKRLKNDTNGKGSSKSERKLENRKKRFNYDAQATYSPIKPSSPAPEVDQGPVVGRCQTLEKKYFRLTSAPNPDTVRPLPILEQTFDLLKLKWTKEQNYSYTCDQFKSIRQDLTVQHIKTKFTVDVYEVHARIALEKGDLGEYNQCQTQLRALYLQNLGGHPVEFKAYRVLYFIHTCNRTDMNDVLADLTPAEKKKPAIKHALDTRSALALGNYHRFFQLYLNTPNMGAYLMDMFVGRERLVALCDICVSYKPDVKLRFLTEELGFESDDESARFICDYGGQAHLEQREEGGEVRFLTGKALRFFEAAKQQAFKKVDIKGQI